MTKINLILWARLNKIRVDLIKSKRLANLPLRHVQTENITAILKRFS